MVIKNSLDQSHDIMIKTVTEGDTVIDATAGNGNDTVFLARLAGPSGKVYAFDIQQKALDIVRRKLEVEGLNERVTLICDDHRNAGKYVRGKVKAAMFNLGYLPGGDHNICTNGRSTADALTAVMELLEVNGVITVVVYYGGDSGFDEKNYIMDFITHLDCRRFAVMRTEFVNQINCPPILVCIEKLY